MFIYFALCYVDKAIFINTYWYAVVSQKFHIGYQPSQEDRWPSLSYQTGQQPKKLKSPNHGCIKECSICTRDTTT